MKLDVLVVGDYCFDLILIDLPGEPVKGQEIYARAMDVTIGGGTFPTSVALKRLGLDTGLHMQLGADFFSRYTKEMIEKAGFSPALLDIHDEDFQRLTVALSYPDDRAFLSYADLPPGQDRETRFGGDILQAHRVRHIHFAHLSATLSAQEMIIEAKRKGITISSDCGWNPWALDHHRLWETISQVDVFMPNEVELKYITSAEELEQGLDIISKSVPLTVVKRGSLGSSAGQKSLKLFVPAIPVEAVETTAAGDCFNAGFLFGYLHEWELDKALYCGNVCGGLSTTASGWQATPSKEQLEAWLEGESFG